MKTLLYILLLAVVLGFSTGTAKAQCWNPAPVVVVFEGGAYDCVGDGGYGNYPLEMNAQGWCYLGAGNCTCAYPYDLDTQVGICAIPPCSPQIRDSWNLTFDWYYAISGGDYYLAWTMADQAYGCDPDEWTKLKIPKLPSEKNKDPIIEALLRRS